MENILPVTTALSERLDAAFPAADGNQLRVIPSLNAGVPQIRVSPRPEVLARIGMTAREFSTAIDLFNDGIKIIEVPIGGQLVDLVATGAKAAKLSLEELRALPIVTRSGA